MGKHFIIQRYLSAVTFVNLENYFDFNIEMLIARNKIKNSKTKTLTGKKGTSNTRAEVPGWCYVRLGSRTLLEGTLRDFGLHSKKLRPAEMENSAPHSCSSRQYTGEVKKVQAISLSAKMIAW